MQSPVLSTADEFDEIASKFLSRFPYVNKSNIEMFAEKAAQWLGLHEFPRDARAYLPHYGMALESHPMEQGVRAIWLRLHNKYIIQHSIHLSGKLGIVLWHEFFEILSAHPKFPTRLVTEVEEKLATQFAVYLLMPEQQLRTQAESLGHPTISNKTNVLAERFGVTTTAMSIRLRELGLQHTSTQARYRYL